MTKATAFIIALPLIALVSAASSFAQGGNVTVAPPARLSATAQQGQAAFLRNCQQCHGAWGQGSEQGPPLIHKIYEPSHHADSAFFFAITRGSRQHHWRFGDMPLQPQVKPDEIPAIIRFVREVQESNGIR